MEVLSFTSLSFFPSISSSLSYIFWIYLTVTFYLNPVLSYSILCNRKSWPLSSAPASLSWNVLTHNSLCLPGLLSQVKECMLILWFTVETLGYIVVAWPLEHIWATVSHTVCLTPIKSLYTKVPVSFPAWQHSLYCHLLLCGEVGVPLFIKNLCVLFQARP
jgi:hypothetical protein